ncbi:MAG: hypothetical protein JWQ94_1077 [Tardiphaga sp.]|jgi:hypothetical protein|nr:hypothetical protein [Tardiphaga sp.]
MRHLVISFVTAVALSTAVTAAGAAVYSPQQQLPASVVDGFKSAPSDLLQQYPSGGAQMISRVRDLAASDPTTLPALINLLKAPLSPAQQSAIVSGLAQVARMALTADRPYYDAIQAAMADLEKNGNKPASDQYASLTGNVGTGAGGAGGGGAGGGGSGAGGPTTSSGFVFGGNNSGSASTFGARSYANQGSSLTSGSVGGIGNSVSP